MLTYNQTMMIGYSIYTFASLSALLQYKKSDKASKVMIWLLVLTLINEALADYFAHRFRNNFMSYGFFNPIQLFFISLYFNFSIKSFERKNIGIYIGAVGAILGFVNYWVIQTPTKMNNYFLLFESIVIVCMCLYSFYSMLHSDDDMELMSNPHFWFTAILLFFWTATFLHWGLFDFLIHDIHVNLDNLLLVLVIINVITYIAFGIVFLRFKKMHFIHANT